jgi:hypothetical protein
MAIWLSKSMQVGELRDFTGAFSGEIHSLDEPRDMAGFARPHANNKVIEVVVSPAAAVLAERSSPHDWVCSGKPTGGGWRLVAGRSDAFIWFGLQI